MAQAWDLTCDRCGYHQEDFRAYSWSAYLLPDGGVTPVQCQPAWCHHCARFVRAELSAEEMVRWADIMEERSFPWEEGEHWSSTRRRVERGRLRIVAASRKSPPRCLTCGATDIELFGFWVSDLTLTHPNCGGSLQESRWKHISFDWEYPLTAYSPEGERLGIQVKRDGE